MIPNRMTKPTMKQKGTINGLGKIKAVFELAPLTVFSGDDIPLEAVDRSAMAMNVLQTLYATVRKGVECGVLRWI